MRINRLHVGITPQIRFTIRHAGEAMTFRLVRKRRPWKPKGGSVLQVLFEAPRSFAINREPYDEREENGPVQHGMAS